MRWIWHIFWSLCLLLSLGFSALWISGQWWTFHYYDRPAPDHWLRSAVFVDDGFALMCIWYPQAQQSLIQPGEEQGFIEAKDPKWWEYPKELFPDPTFHFAWVTVDLAPRRPGSIGLDWICVPLLYLIILFLLPSLGQVARWLFFRRRRKKGHCVKCNYDLQGITTGVCPECGHVVKKPVVKPLNAALAGNEGSVSTTEISDDADGGD